MSAISVTSRVHVAQSPAPSRTATIARHALVGGALGAAAGAGVSLLGVPVIGVLSAPITAAIGGAAGILLGGLLGFLRSRGGSDGAHVGASMIQSPPPPPSRGSGGLPPAPPLPRS